MKNVLVILDGLVSQKLLSRLVDANPANNIYDVVYLNDYILPKTKPSNFTFYKFDPTSASKLKLVMDKVTHSDGLVVLDSKADTVSVIENILNHKNNLPFTVYDNWGLDIQNDKIQYYRGNEVLANGLLEKLPDIPVLAQNVGLRQGEIMEIKIPFGSSYAYRYIGGIAQKDWKIFALYRNNHLISIRPSLVLKPNDIILIIGKPKVLIQVYSAITRSVGHFPMPFGNNIYLYLDLVLQPQREALTLLHKALILHKKFKNQKLIIKITRPTTIETMDLIKEKIDDIENTVLEIDYYNQKAEMILKTDKKRFDVGMVVTSANLLNNSKINKHLVNLQVPIFKSGYEDLEDVKYSMELLNKSSDYEQISPILFDISAQLKYNVRILNCDPIGDDNKANLVEHLANLAKLFGLDIATITNNNNPFNELRKEENIVQILPLKDQMLKTRWTQFFNIDSDLLSFDLEEYNQILIPVVE